jgi:hypothetical protein
MSCGLRFWPLATFIGRRGDGTRLQCRGTATGVDLRAERTSDGPLDISERQVRRRTRSHATGSRSQATGARGTGGSRLETVGHGPARTSRWRGGRRVAQPGRQNARRAGGALERDCAVFQPVNATLTACFSKKLNCATKMIDMKVVDETSLYNICKGHPMFFSTV